VVLLLPLGFDIGDQVLRATDPPGSRQARCFANTNEGDRQQRTSN
jgi:hypothetical protein